MDSSRDVRPSHPELQQHARPAVEMVAGAGPLETRRFVDSGTGRLAALVQGDAGGGHTPRRIPQNHGRAPAAVSLLDTRTYPGSAGPFHSSAQALAAALGSVRSNSGITGSGLPECRRSVPGPRLSS